MQFDPVASEASSSSEPSDSVEAIIRRDHRAALDTRDHGDEGEPPARQGLPPAFRMRHARHYVEQVMGDAPIRTVREIALADLADPDEGDAEPIDLRPLEASIRSLGVLEPLLVRPREGRYQVIGGVKRLRAARAAGLHTVPCLVHEAEADEDRLQQLRDAVTVRPTPPPAPIPSGPDEERRTAVPERPHIADVSVGLNFVSALMPAMAAAAGDPFRKAVLADLAAAELSRAQTITAAAEVLSRVNLTLERRAVEAGEVIRAAVASVSSEARLRGVRVEIVPPEGEYVIPADHELLATAAAALLHGALALVAGRESAIRVRAQGTTIRPALIVDVELPDVGLDSGTARRFFDSDLEPHPCGPSGGLQMACVHRIARLHGGRASVQLQGCGCTLTFVVPRVS